MNNEDFLEHLTELFRDSKTKGSVYLGQKRLTKDGPDSVLHSQQAPYSIIFRASNGRSTREKQTKRSARQHYTTVVEPKNVAKFWLGYTEAIKKGASGLRKKEKKKAKKN